MTVELDPDAMKKIPINDDAMNCAIEAAMQAFFAGGEEVEQLNAGIRAYLWRVKQLTGKDA